MILGLPLLVILACFAGLAGDPAAALRAFLVILRLAGAEGAR